MHWLLSNLILPQANEIVSLKLEYIRRLFSEHVLTPRNVFKQENSMIQSLPECWYVQCSKLSCFSLALFKLCFWFNVSLFLLSSSSHNFNFDEDRSPDEEWKHMANKVNHICATLSISPSARSNLSRIRLGRTFQYIMHRTI